MHANGDSEEINVCFELVIRRLYNDVEMLEYFNLYESDDFIDTSDEEISFIDLNDDDYDLGF